MKAILESLDGLPEAVKSEYEQRADGKFVLKLEGTHPTLEEANRKVAEFRDNNIALVKDKAMLEGRLKGFDGVDPMEYATLKTRVADFEKKGGVKDPADIETRIRTAVEAAVKPINEKLTAAEQAREESNRRLAFRDLETALTEAGLKVGVDEKALPDFINRGLEIFDLDGTAKDGDTPLFSKDKPSEPLSMLEWATGLASEAPHLFKKSGGGGAGGGAGAGGKKVVSSDPLVIGQNLEKIAKGEVVVSR